MLQRLREFIDYDRYHTKVLHVLLSELPTQRRSSVYLMYKRLTTHLHQRFAVPGST